MQYERLSSLSNGDCIKIDNVLNSTASSIEFELECDKKYEDHITIFNTREVVIDGQAFSNNNRVQIKEPIFKSKSVDLVFNVLTYELNEGDTIEGIISIISNVGVLDIPYKYFIKTKNYKKNVMALESITDYYDYFIKDFDKAKELFVDPLFVTVPFMQDEFALSLYDGLVKGSNIDIAIIEFFKAYEIDITKIFKDKTDIVKYYIDETLDNIDLNSIKNKEKFEEILELNNVKELKIENKSNEVIDEAIEAIDNLRDRDLLNAIASMCVRNDYIDEVAFNVYLRVIEKGSNITGIYDKFLLSIPENCKKKLPLYIYRYYFEDKSFSFEDKSKLYDNIISTFDENEEVYKLYYHEIIEYAITRIYQNKITESLIKIYNKVLCREIINENNCNNVMYLLRSHKLIIKDNSIRKVIIKYTVTDKETKYDVINNIAYVPIFFDSYIMFYEDVIGNRYYTKDVTIRTLFEKRDLESYIIDNFPQREIIDMTKIIKLNELEKFNNEFEIEEINELSSKIKLNNVITKRFISKAIDFYFNKVTTGGIIGSSVLLNLINIDFDILSNQDKKKLVKIFYGTHEYKYLYEKRIVNDMNLLDDDELANLFIRYIELNEIDNKTVFNNNVFDFVMNRKKDIKLIEYLAACYEGSIENLLKILDVMLELKMDANDMARVLLITCLECNVSKYIDYIFENFIPKTESDAKLVMAYLNKKATDYVLDDVDTEKKYFDRLLERLINRYDDLDNEPVVFLLAITKYVSTFDTLVNNDLRRVLIKSIEILLDRELIFAYFKKLNKFYGMPFYIMNKEYIEYHASSDFVPKAILQISGQDEKKEIELSKMFVNIYVKKITVFKNEVINYEIINSNDPTTGVLATGRLVYDTEYESEYHVHSRTTTTYDYINDVIVYFDRDNIEKLKKTVLDMTKKQVISESLFNI